jgi:hypothetical protein
MTTVVKFSIALLALFVPALHRVADTNQLACMGETYVVASGEKQAIKRFSRRNLTLTSDEDRTAITYGDGGPMEADITESHYRVARSPQSGDWVLILLNRETLDVTVSEFTSLPNHKHRSVRFEGKCKFKKPVA